MGTLNVMYGRPGLGTYSANTWEEITSAENITTSGTAATGVLSANDRNYARVKAVDAAVYVKPILSGATAVAAGTGAYLAIGDIMDFRVKSGWRISVINA